MERFNLILLVAFGGSIGAVSRYLLSSLIQDWILTSFPIGTLIINVLGCFLIGFFLKIQAASSVTQQIWQTFIIIGFIGSFTTFSTFANDIYELFRNGKPYLGILYFLGSSILGVTIIYITVTYLNFFPHKK
ncbi:fluoride efflux transporter CrcB [Bacillus sp. EB600]|uniref:fluoride efflux transporter CrcB n=1 Tax=Bacillus sp. EB600 TaxID=2806345 RepID=UPI00210A1010|nr:fluoride efflux transporter CrcB [Bacillus sp. EB600]MCQ6282783.1 fluoride efflux transporter CrcB [Bacillus sp. EB600]